MTKIVPEDLKKQDFPVEDNLVLKISSNTESAPIAIKLTSEEVAQCTIDAKAAQEQLKAYLSKCTTSRASVPLAELSAALAKHFPDDAQVQILNLQVREKARKDPALPDLWAALLEQFPGNITILRFRGRWLNRLKRDTELSELIDNQLPENLKDFDASMARAKLMDDVGLKAEANSLFLQLVELYPDQHAVRIEYAKRLRKHGQVHDAYKVIEPIINKLTAGSKAAELAEGLTYINTLLTRLEPETDLAGLDVSILALKHAILYFKDRRSVYKADGLHKTVLVTGGLGAGGAERQLTRIACMLENHRSNDGSIGKFALHEPLEVLVKSHAADTKNDFFVPLLRDHAVIYKQIDEMPVIQPVNQNFNDNDAELMALLSLLSSSPLYGITRLTPYFKANNVQVASLWQDGTCLFGALGALLAGVGHIQLVFRGLPPNVRVNRHKPEYEILYQSLAQIPGVSFYTNSKVAALAYAKWLKLPLERFNILYNGVENLLDTRSHDDEMVWEDFCQQTEGATETIGGVFRFESDKQPITWIRMAQQYAIQSPNSRFIIVGHGRLFDHCVELTEKMGLRNRFLFVGHSTAVGYWYSKMDVKVLMSRFEGLPNVLIEAQLLGIPVVSTPAGGAIECFIPGVTGEILDCAENPCLDQACANIKNMLITEHNREERTSKAINYAIANFAPNNMLNQFVAFCVGEYA